MSRESVIDKELDEEFIKATIIIQNNYQIHCSPHDQQHIESWIVKLAKYNHNYDSKANRNKYILHLLECVLDKRIQGPFDKNPPEGVLAALKPRTDIRRSTEVIQNFMRSEEIEKMIEANLNSIGEEDFDLTPRDTFPTKTAKVDLSNLYDITPSKSNRYRGRESNNQRRESQKLSDAQVKIVEEDEEDH